MEIGIKHILLFITIVVFIGVFYSIISKRLYNVGKEGFDLSSMGKGSTDMGSIGKGSTDMGSMGKGSTDMGSMGKGSTDMGSIGKGSTDMGSMGKGSTDSRNPKPVEPNTAKPDAPKHFEPKNDSVPNTTCDNNFGDKENLPLKEYIIKACSNSAYDPNYAQPVNVTILETRIAEGYRFLDLNVFSSEGKLYVGYSADNKPTLTNVSIPFTEALDCIKKNAFVKSSMKLDEGIPLLEGTQKIGPSIRDTYVEYPMFVLIRVYRSEKSTLDIIEKVMDHLQTTADSRYYRRGQGKNEEAIEIDGCTPLSKIKGKILFVVDIMNLLQIYTPIETPTADQIPEATRKHLKRFVNIYTAGNIWRHAMVNKSAPLRISDLNQPYKTNLFNMQIMYPSTKETTNPDAHNVIMEHSIQTIVVRPYLTDTNLRAYTQLFKDLKRPMICGAYVHNYIKRLEK